MERDIIKASFKYLQHACSVNECQQPVGFSSECLWGL